jgi:Family of unknown function (DUF6166)
VPSSVAYVGIRGPQPDYGHGGPRVVGVIRNGEKRTLTLADERYLHQASFEWGYDGAGPALLAQAILNDYLGVEVDPLVARVFMRDVVACLPSEFELDGRDVAQWLSDRLAAALRSETRASR